MSNNKSWIAGFNHGNTAAGTNGYKPGNRTYHGTLVPYNAGFQAGMRHYHELTRLQRE